MRIQSIAAALLLGAASAHTAPEVLPEAKVTIDFFRAAYPKVEPKSFPKSPANHAYVLRGARGTVEVGIQSREIVYLIFRKAIGGSSWSHEETQGIYAGLRGLIDLYPPDTAKYRGGFVGQIQALVIIRKDFDAKLITGGL